MKIMLSIYPRIMILFLLCLGFACTTDLEEEAVITAARQYAKDNTDIEVELEVAEIEGDYARVQVKPADPEAADEATMYLRKEKGRWKGIIIGTGFSPEDYKNLKIPEKIREKE
jgi:hypothetical protein